ncbi:MAG TPA: GntR family transcriptional regulator, partial [Actinopolymorphaceae bacterium]
MTPDRSSAEGVGELDRDSPVPLYHQLEQALLRLVTTETMAAGSRFPSETELCARFGVTRPTVRQALDRLVRVGVLRRERGRGTFVASVPEAPPHDPETTRVVKVVMPSLTELIHLRVLAGVVDQAHDEGLQVVLTHSGGRPASQERELADVAGTDGVLLWPVGETPRRSPALLDLASQGIPVVFVDRYLDGDFDHVVVDDETGAYDLTTHLIDLGHRRIAFVHAESTALSSVRLRHRGYRAAM